MADVGATAVTTLPAAPIRRATRRTFLRPMRSASRPVAMTVAARAMVWMLAARVTSPPLMLRSRVRLTRAVLLMLGAAPWIAAIRPRNGRAYLIIFGDALDINNPLDCGVAGLVNVEDRSVEYSKIHHTAFALNFREEVQSPAVPDVRGQAGEKSLAIVLLELMSGGTPAPRDGPRAVRSADAL